MYRIFPGSRNDIENLIRPLSIWQQDFFLHMVLENKQFELMQKNIWILPLCSEFPLGSRNYIKISIRPLYIELRHFFLQKWCHWFSKIFPPDF